MKRLEDEVFWPVKLYCSTGKVEATVMVAVGTDMRDNVDSFVTTPCVGCAHWTEEIVARTEREIRAESRRDFGSDDEGITGIREGRQNRLEQLWVDRARFVNGAEHQLMLGMCTPITRGKL